MIAEFKEIEYWYYTIKPGNIATCSNYRFSDKTARSCGHVYISEHNDDPAYRIQVMSENDFYVPNFGDKVYVSKKSKISRDLVRKAYDITLSKDKADCIIIPKVSAFYRRSAHAILDLENGKIAIVYINDQREGVDLGDSAIKLMLRNSGFDRLTEVDKILFISREPRSAYFIPKVEEYVEILSGDESKRYYSDVLLPLKPDVTVSIETLDAWRRLMKNDFGLFEKSLLNRDARDYPLTITLFLENEPCGVEVFSDKPLEMLRQMGVIPVGKRYNRHARVSNLAHKEITVKDWDMAQRWLMYNFGVDENGGFTDSPYANAYALCCNNYKLIRQRTAVAPIRITHPMTLEDIAAIR